MDKGKFQVLGYTITSDENFMRSLYPVPYELDIQFEDLYTLARKGKKSAIKRLIRLIKKYPRVPALKNYLSVLYSNMGQIEKSYEVNHWIVAEHPEYVFGKLNLAAEYFLKKEYDKIPEVLGESMELKILYPQREIFHIVEVIGFIKIAILYFCAIGDLEQSEIRLDILREIAPDSEEFEIAKEYFGIAQLDAAVANMGEYGECSIQVKVKKTVLTDMEIQPEFIHKEISLLYENDFYLDRKIITEILKLPRKSLIEDLNKVLEDSIIRFNYFKKDADNVGFDDESSSFVIHALLILSEIDAVESLDNIFEVLRQDNTYLDFYIGDIMTEYLWLVLYKITSPILGSYKQFMFEPGIYSYSKSSVSEMVLQIALHQTERKDEVIEWFRGIFRFFLDSSLKDNVIDSDLLGMMVNGVLDFNGIALMPEIEELYEMEMVDLYACGDIESVRKHFADKQDIDYTREIVSIFSIYEAIQLWGINDNYDDHYKDEDMHASGFNDFQLSNTNKKTGRNEPCPCGSGKKFKKCCMNN